jgi:tetratricopeptide (TPR) repeat protein
MTDNRIEVSSVSDSRIARYSSDSVKKSLSLAKKLSNPDCQQEESTKYSDFIQLIETAQKDLDIDRTKLTKKILEGKFDFNDFIIQMQMLKNVGGLGGLLNAIPGMNNICDKELKQGEEQLEKAEIIIYSMTEDERADPDLLAGSVSRQRRVAEDSGYSDEDVSKFIAVFARVRNMNAANEYGNFPGTDDEASVNSDRDAEYYYDLGMEKYRLEDYQSAIDNFTQSVRLNPDNVIACCYRAESKYELRDYQGAINDLTQSIELDPDYTIAYCLRAQAKYKLEDHQGAIDDLTQSIELDPDYAIAYYWRAAAKYNLGNYQSAIDDFTHSIKLDPNNSDAYQWRDIALNIK